MDELFSSRRAQGTKKVIKSAEDVFIEFLQVKGISVESCMHSNDVLDNAVKEFFITVKRKDGERYKSKSLHTQVRRETVPVDVDGKGSTASTARTTASTSVEPQTGGGQLFTGCIFNFNM